MKFEYLSTARTQTGTFLNLIMYEATGIKKFQESIECGAGADEVANKLESIAKQIREEARL